MKNSLKPNNRINPVTNTDKEVIMDRFRGSIIHVLSETDNFKELVSNPNVVNSIANSVFASLYKSHGNYFLKKKGDNFSSLIDNIIFNTEKVVKVEETKQQILRASEIVSEDAYSTISLNVVHSSVSEKLTSEDTKDLDFFESKFKNDVKDVVYAGSNLDLSNLPPRKDLLYLDLILVAEGTNKNKDTIPAEELKSRYLTLIGMPLVEEHITQAIRGVFYESTLVRIKSGKTPGSVTIVKKGGKLAVRAKAYVYKNRFPREAYVLKDRQEQGLLRYSVELAYGKSECSACHKVFASGEPYCEHLMLRNSPGDHGFSRIVQDICFIGGSYTQNPAEKDAVSLDVVDPGSLKVKNKKSNSSCVNNKDNTGKDIVTSSLDKGLNYKKTTEGDTLSHDKNGGNSMFQYDSVEELLASTEVKALVDAKVADILAAQEEAFASSLDEMETLNANGVKENETLSESVKVLNEKLDEATASISEMKNEKRVSDAILSLQTSGYEFESDEEITAFSTRIMNMEDEDANFVMDLMRKQVTAATGDSNESDVTTENKEDKNEQEDNKSEEETLKASQHADTNAESKGNSTIKSIRDSWTKRMVDLNGA